MKKITLTHKKSIFISGLALALLFIFSYKSIINAPGILTPKPVGAYLNGVFPSLTPTGVSLDQISYDVENAFPNLTFIDPVDMAELPGGNEFLVVGLQGHIWKFTNNQNTSSKELLLDLSDNVVSYADGGMLGIVLHPEFGIPGSPNSEYIYVFYRYTPVQGTDQTSSVVNGYMRLSRFNLPLGANAINPSSEQILINIFDSHDWHNGGDMFFGPEDGFLYLAVGDEGASNDSYNVTQQINSLLFSGVLRIDVDQRGGNISHPIRKQPLNSGTPPNGWPNSFTQGYYIPNDNPWLDPNGSILEEFYAIGTRSPHRMTIDPPTGDIWLGDIGQGSKEEISLVKKGDNLQWPYREGDQAGPKTKPDPIIGNDQPPIHAYGRNIGRSVIGGFVYRGNKYPGLVGKYFFGDHETQDVWSLTKTGENTGDVNFLFRVPVSGAGSKDGISSFFVDSNGIIYVLDLFGTAQDGGVIRKIITTGSIPDPPQKLSDLNVFSDLQNLTPIDGIIPYDVNSPLWSDGAKKRRWIALPNDGNHDSSLEQITFENEENWSFPPGTVTIKQFDLPTDENDPSKITKLETRFLVFTEDNQAYGLTYKWNDEQTDAFLIGIDEQISQDYTVSKSDGSSTIQTWDFPSRSQCMQCHTSVAGYSLGLKTRQLNKDYTYPSTGINSNQLETWNHLNMFNHDIGTPENLPKSAHINSELASSEMKVRSFIDSNCAYCHRPNGVEGAFDGRALTALYDQSLINADVVSHASLPGFKIVKPQDHANSMLFMRDSSTSSDKMPPIGRNLVDEDYINELVGWIDGLDINGPETITEGFYTLQARHSNMFLAVDNASNNDDANVVQITSNQENHSNWLMEDLGNNKYRIKAKHSNMVLSLRDLRTDRGVQVIQEPWSGKQHQLWYFESVGDDYYRIVNVYNGLDLSINDNSLTENEPVISWTKEDTENQHWRPIILSSPITSPTLSSIAQTDTTVDLNWTASTSDTNITNYNIYNDNLLIATVDNILSYQVTNLTASTLYNFTVTGIDANGIESASSNVVTITTNAEVCEFLDETNLSDLDWFSAEQAWGTTRKNTNLNGNTLTINGQTFIHGIGTHANSEIIYNIDGEFRTFKSYIGIDDNVGPNTSASVQFEIFGDDISLFRSQTLTAADDAQLIEVDIKEVAQLRLVVDQMGSNAFDHADWAGALLTSCSEIQPPSMPFLSSSTQTDTTVDLSWTASNSSTYITNYNIYKDGVVEATLDDVLSYQVTGLSAETTYAFTVIAIDADNNESAASNTLSINTGSTIPTSPSLSSTGQTNTTVDLSWTAASDNIGVTNYNIYKDGILEATLGNVLNYQVTGLTEATAYNFTVTALDADNNESAASNTLAITTSSTIPSTPTLSSTAKTDTTVDLSWTAANDDIGVTNYNIYKDGILEATLG
ncbi:NPCBM/NEW2 domain-containing protein, partial [Algibacter aquimarinus]|uniref:NPCBM/NEW2 domain-containing protein n=1 Tax=Algibacter aquimarinus TaxID=1136748 RepID=UPI0031EB3527